VSGTRKLFLRRLSIVLLSSAAALLAVEAGMRIKDGGPLIERRPCSPGWNHPQYLFMPDPDLGYRLRPYFQGFQENPHGDFKVRVVINSEGERDLQFTARGPRSNWKIITLGDSFTFGEGVGYKDCYPTLLETRLRAAHGLDVQVFNQGTPGYSLQQSAGRLGQIISRIDPDIAIVVWTPYLWAREASGFRYMNGYLVPADRADRIHQKGDNLFYSKYGKGGAAAGADLWLQAHSRLYFRLKYGTGGHLQRMGGYRIPRPEDGKAVDMSPEALEGPLEVLRLINSRCRARQARLVLCALGSTEGTDKEIKAYCDKHGIAFISVAQEAFYEDSAYSDFLFANDPHFNEKGHAHIAEELAPFVSKLIESPAPPRP